MNENEPEGGRPPFIPFNPAAHLQKNRRPDDGSGGGRPVPPTMITAPNAKKDLPPVPAAPARVVEAAFAPPPPPLIPTREYGPPPPVDDEMPNPPAPRSRAPEPGALPNPPVPSPRRGVWDDEEDEPAPASEMPGAGGSAPVPYMPFSRKADTDSASWTAPSAKVEPASPAAEPLPHPWVAGGRPSIDLDAIPPPRTGVPALAIVVLLLLIATVGGGAFWLKHRSPAGSPEVALAVPTTASLTIGSKPAGARVFIDGQSRGTTPLTIKDLHASVYNIEVLKAGYLPMHKQVGLDGGETSTENFALLRVGTLVVAGLPGGAQVLVDGAVGARKIMLPVGSHRVVVRAGGYGEFSQSVRIQPGKTVTVTAHLASLSAPVAPPVPVTAPVEAPGAPPPPPQQSVVIMPAGHGGAGVTGYGQPAAPPPGQPAPPPPAPAPAAPRPASGVVVGERHDVEAPAAPSAGIPGL